MHLCAVSAGNNHRMLSLRLPSPRTLDVREWQPTIPLEWHHPGYCLLCVTQAPTPFSCTCRQTSSWGYMAVRSSAKQFLWANPVHHIAGCHWVASHSESRSLPSVQTFCCQPQFCYQTSYGVFHCGFHFQFYVGYFMSFRVFSWFLAHQWIFCEHHVYRLVYLYSVFVILHWEQKQEAMIYIRWLC